MQVTMLLVSKSFKLQMLKVKSPKALIQSSLKPKVERFNYILNLKFIALETKLNCNLLLFMVCIRYEIAYCVPHNRSPPTWGRKQLNAECISDWNSLLGSLSRFVQLFHSLPAGTPYVPERLTVVRVLFIYHMFYIS